MRPCTRALFVSLCLFTLCSWQAEGQTTVAQEKANNTSASASFGGWTDNRSGISTNPFDIAPRNISKGRNTASDVHNLMYSGFNGKILVETQEWFCTTQTGGTYLVDGQSFPQCHSHSIVGYNSYDSNWANSAVDDMYARGFDGFVADVMGGNANCGFPNFNSSCGSSDPTQNNYLLRDTATKNLRARINGNPTYSSVMKYALMEDNSAFIWGENCGPYASGPQYPQCIEMKLEADLSYYNSTYFGDSTYLRDPGTGQPIVLFFVDEPGFTQCTQANACQLVERTCITQADCWQGIWDGLRNYGIPARFIFENDAGLNGAHPDSNGGYAWVTPTNDQTNWDDSWGSGNQNYLADFYSTATQNPSSIVFGVSYKGYDEEDAPFHTPPGRLIAQRCGQVWLNTFQMPSGLSGSSSGFYNSSNQLPYMMIATWDDYEEGSEIETGIDNCVNDSLFSESINGNTLSWSLQFSDSTYGAPSTIDHYVLFYSTDGTNLYTKDSNVSPSNCSFSSPTISCSINLGSYTWSAGNYTLYVKAIGKPSIANHFSANSVSYSVGAPPSCSLSASPTSLGFGNQQIGTVSGSQQVSVTASGASCNITSVSLTGQFAQSNNCPSSLAAGSSCQVNVTFNPTSAGQQSGTLTINSNNSSNGSPQVSLSGTGSTSCTATICSIDDMSGWTRVSGSTSSSITQNVGSPSLDGASAQFSLYDTAAYSSVKWENYLTANSSVTHLTLDMQVYFQSPNSSQALALGMSQIVSGVYFPYRWECDFKDSKLWRVWNAATNAWSSTGVACNAFPANTWVHLVFDAQRVNGQLQYNWFSVNGTQYNVNQTFNPSSQTGDTIKVVVNLYGDSAADAYSIWVDSMNLTEQ